MGGEGRQLYKDPVAIDRLDSYRMIRSKIMFNVTPKPICEKCQGTLVPDQEVDLLTGMSLVVYRCINCGRRTKLDKEPRPLTSKQTDRDTPVKNSAKPDS